MIDTVVIKVPMADLLPQENINPQSIWNELGWDSRTKKGYTTWIYNPPDSGVYYPRLTGNREQKYNWAPMVKIEFSVPKLFWGNNVDELENHHFAAVVQTLQKKLHDMGFNPSNNALMRASVVKVHYSKNFIIEDGYTVHGIINDIRRVYQGGRLLKTSQEYNPSGSSVNMHNKSFALSFYDKMAEVDDEVLERIDIARSHLEILRMEVRLESRRKINQIFTKLNLSINPTFAKVFDTEKSRSILTYIWKEQIAPQIAFVSNTTETPIEIISQLFRLSPNITTYKVLKLTSLITIGRSPGGLSELRSILTRHMTSRSWYRLYNDIKEVNRALESTRRQSWWHQIEMQLAKYDAISLVSN